MASILPNYKFIGVINKRNIHFKLSNKNLEEYFIPKKNTNITEEFLEKHMCVVGYTKSAIDYLFIKIN